MRPIFEATATLPSVHRIDAAMIHRLETTAGLRGVRVVVEDDMTGAASSYLVTPALPQDRVLRGATPVGSTWRVSWFDADEVPHGHQNFPSLRAALENVEHKRIITGEIIRTVEVEVRATEAEAAARPHDADVRGRPAVITRSADFRPPVGQHVSPSVKIAKRQGQERELMGDSVAEGVRAYIDRRAPKEKITALVAQHGGRLVEPDDKGGIVALFTREGDKRLFLYAARRDGVRGVEDMDAWPWNESKEVHPLAFDARDRYYDDLKARHGAAEYWKGQAAGLFLIDPEKGAPEEARAKFDGAKLDERRTAAGRAKLAEIRRTKLNEIASVMDYLVKRALADPRDHEARELAVRSMLANHEALSSNRITHLLGPVERAIAKTVEHGTAEVAIHTLGTHGFKDITPHGLLGSTLESNDMQGLTAKFAHIERGWIKVAEHHETDPGHGVETDTSSGFTSGPEMHEVTVFRTAEGHVARVLSAALIAGTPYVESVRYLRREGF